MDLLRIVTGEWVGLQKKTKKTLILFMCNYTDPPQVAVLYTEYIYGGATDINRGTEIFEVNSLYTDLVLFVKLVSGCEEACYVFSHLHILLKDKNNTNHFKSIDWVCFVCVVVLLCLLS